MPKRQCKYSDDMLKEFPSVKKGKISTEVFCNVCSSSLSIAHKGKKDIEDHLKTEKHKKNLRSQAGASGLQKFVTTASNSSRIKAAKATLAFHTVRHHQSYNSMGCTTKVELT
ncbi:hypothetical protein PPYR_02372 [Photinus pyralis]|uniref:Uncharacterized protein n=1 Tax=Photinus pyralis TaxID=7054 RepID=A0A5N4B724_PHOPY|nr:hypothetical protein PPYR_02372 [Photinus pyralis]